MIKIIKDQTLDQERAFYNLKDTTLVNITFQGKADGESALKEARNCNVKSCLFDLRYPLWHVNKFTLQDSIFTVNSRAPIWYTMNGIIDKCQLSCPKALRECEEINIVNSNISGEEFGWKCNNIKLEKVISALNTGFNGQSFSDIANYLLTGSPIADPYMCLADFGSFSDIHEKADKVYQDKMLWANKSLNNIATAGIFASDRSIREYADRIWGLKRIK